MKGEGLVHSVLHEEALGSLVDLARDVVVRLRPPRHGGAVQHTHTHKTGASNGGVRALRTRHDPPSSTAPCSASGGTDRDKAFGDATVSRRILRETAVGALNKIGASSSPDHMRSDTPVKTQARRENVYL